MPPRKILVRRDDVHADLNTLRRDVDELPSAATLTQVEGAKSSIGGTFTNSLRHVTAVTVEARMNIQRELADSDSDVRTTLDELMEQDDEAATEADKVDPSAATSTPQPGASATYGTYGPDYHTRV